MLSFAPVRGESRHPRRVRAAYALARTALALALLALFGASHALPALHFAAIAHELCAEHGVLHHADSAAETHEHAEDAPALGVRAGNAAEHEHEHCCSAGTSTQQAVQLHTPATSVLALARRATTAPADCDAAKSSVAVLRYAPKLAPPV